MYERCHSFVALKLILEDVLASDIFDCCIFPQPQYSCPVSDERPVAQTVEACTFLRIVSVHSCTLPLPIHHCYTATNTFDYVIKSRTVIGHDIIMTSIPLDLSALVWTRHFFHVAEKNANTL